MRWKEISGYENIYSVSDTGMVRNDRTGNLIGQWICHGYLYVKLCNNYRSETKRVHRLVAEAFCKKEVGKTDVNHINGDKQDNRAENLEWVTKSENMQHAFENGLQRKTSMGFVKRVVCLNDGKVYNGAGHASRYYGIPQGTIYTCCARKSKGRHFTFRFEEDVRKQV